MTVQAVSNQPGPKRCFICDRPDHLRAQCPWNRSFPPGPRQSFPMYQSPGPRYGMPFMSRRMIPFVNPPPPTVQPNLYQCRPRNQFSPYQYQYSRPPFNQNQYSRRPFNQNQYSRLPFNQSYRFNTARPAPSSQYQAANPDRRPIHPPSNRQS